MGKARILIIEDEEGIRKFMKRILEPGYEVHMASNGAEGLKQARWVHPDLILLDIRMPGLDGLTVLAKLKANEQTRMIPVIIVSAKGETDTLLEGQRGGAVDQLIKPFTVEDLHSAIERQLIVRGEDASPDAERGKRGEAE